LDETTGTTYRQNNETCEWERYNPDTGVWEPCEEPEWITELESIPCEPEPVQPQEIEKVHKMAAPPGCQSGAYLPTDYGIVPDQNGMVSPLVWVTEFQGTVLDDLTADDTLDFFMAVNVNWMLATDSDPALLAAIGPENVTWHELPGEPDGAVLRLNDVTVRNLALFMNGTGLTGIDSDTPYGTWTLRHEAQSNSIIVKWREIEVTEIPLD